MHIVLRRTWKVLLFALALPVAWAAAPPGEQLFSSNCAACHGLDGRGGEHAPNIATNADVQRLPDADLSRIIRNGIPAAGMPGFGALLKDDERTAVLHYLRVLQGGNQGATVSGDPAKGRELFFGSAHCAECHMVNGRGGFLGADLSVYGKTHAAADIREAIGEPNKNLDERHGTVAVKTREGKRYLGVLRNEDNFSLQMQTTDGVFHSFDKSDLQEIQRQARSLMPADYGATLRKSQLDDLVSFLATTPGAKTKDATDDDDQ
ncbi:MAG TPA: c-type cytochrome [Bryobacteraceae bacterium]|nr:c-type cytochrome [Bryobacteraceae bacterium]